MSKPDKNKQFAKAYKDAIKEMTDKHPELIEKNKKEELEENGFEEITIHWVTIDEGIICSEDVKVSELPDDLNTKK